MLMPLSFSNKRSSAKPRDWRWGMVELREEKRGRTREGGLAWSAEDFCCGRWVSRRMEREKE